MKFALLLAFFCLLVPTPAQADLDNITSREAFLKEIEGYSFETSSFYPTSKMAYSTLKKLIQTKDIRSVDQLLDEIAKIDSSAETPELKSHTYDGLFARTSMVIKSRSQHRASRKKPRVLLFNHDASFVMAYSGTPEDPRYNLVEISQSKGNKSEGFAIVFSKDGKQPAQFHDDSKDAKPKFTSCLTCHTKDFRPNIDNYAYWPGWIGESDEETSPYDEQVIQDLKKNEAQNPRYKYVLPHFGSGTLAVFNGTGRRNTLLASKLFNRQYKAIAEKLKAHPSYEPFKYAIVGALMNCQNIEKMIPQDWLNGRRSLDDVSKDTLDRMRAYRERQEKEFSLNAPFGKAASNANEYFNPVVSKWRWVVEQFMGQSLQGWSLSRDHGSYNFMDATGMGPYQTLIYLYEDAGVQTFPLPLLQVEDREDETDPPTIHIRAGNSRECEQLEKKSLGALSKVQPAASAFVDRKQEKEDLRHRVP